MVEELVEFAWIVINSFNSLVNIGMDEGLHSIQLNTDDLLKMHEDYVGFLQEFVDYIDCMHKHFKIANERIDLYMKNGGSVEEIFKKL